MIETVDNSDATLRIISLSICVNCSNFIKQVINENLLQKSLVFAERKNYRLLTLFYNIMLEYTKTILGKVSFDKYLFKKELEKSFNQLEPTEIQILHKWLEMNYKKEHPEIINYYFEHEKKYA